MSGRTATMLVTVEIPMALKGRTNRTTYHKTIVGSVARDFLIPEYPSTEFQLAFRCEVPGGDAGPRMRDFLVVDGRYYTESASTCDDGQRFGLDYVRSGSANHVFFERRYEHIEKLVTAIDKQAGGVGSSYGVAPPRLVKAINAAKPVPSDGPETEAPIPYRPPPFSHLDVVVENGVEVLDSKEMERVITEFSAYMARFIAVDGRILVREAEPVLTLSGDRAALTVDIVRRHDGETAADLRLQQHHNGRSFGYFGVSKIDEAIEYGRELLAGMSPGRDVLNYVKGLEIVDADLCEGTAAEAMTLVDLAQSAKMSFLQIRNNEGIKSMNRMSQDEFTVYRALHDGLAATVTDDPDPRIEEALSAILSDDRLSYSFFGKQEFSDAARAKFDRWEQRPVDIAAAPGLGMPFR